MIEFRNVEKIYSNGVKALSNASFKIESGEFVFIVGESGAGKSTILKLLLKEINPTSGAVIVNGQNLIDMEDKDVPYYRRGLGVVFQDFRLLANRDVYDNVAFAMEIIEAPRKEIRRRVPMVLAMVGLSSKAKCYPSELSGGEQQRVAIARALVNRPAILIADEPSGNLDPATTDEIMEIINTANRQGTTVIMATHARDIVDTMAKRVITLKNGVIVRDEEKGGYFNEN
ncbi:MAG TPA: cell division ATP-binding protein FtsE [Clostridiales bacterium]|nr:cell division ATP-binding protein FtsE [Clostridiales bacterium]